MLYQLKKYLLFELFILIVFPVIAQKAGDTVNFSVRRKTKRVFSSEQKITIVMEALPAEMSVAELCRKYSIHQAQFYIIIWFFFLL